MISRWYSNLVILYEEFLLKIFSGKQPSSSVEYSLDEEAFHNQAISEVEAPASHLTDSRRLVHDQLFS